MIGRRLGFWGTMLAMLVVIGLAAAADVIPFRQVLAHDRSVQLAQEQQAALVAANRALEREIAALQTPGEIERLAREQFGMVMPGETAVVAVAVPDDQLPVSELRTALEEHQPWWRSFWNFLTGRDLVADG